MLSNRSKDQKGINDAHAMKESEITPINYFFDVNLLKNEQIRLNSNYQVWLNKEDVHISKGLTDGNVKGLVICKGDVTFDSDVTSFEGLIVAGGKVIVNHSMRFSANEEIIKSILRECDESQKYSKGDTDYHFEVCEIFKHYQSIYTVPDGTNDIETESMKSISAIQFEDILGFENWKKNID